MEGELIKIALTHCDICDKLKACLVEPGGITTYPLADDDNQRHIHAECLKLAEQGKIYRHRVTKGVTIWMPTKELRTRGV